MTYEQAKLVKSTCESELKAADESLKKWEPLKLPNGLTPDYVRGLPEWQEAKAKQVKAFADLRNINQYMNKHFKKEMRAERH